MNPDRGQTEKMLLIVMPALLSMVQHWKMILTLHIHVHSDMLRVDNQLMKPYSDFHDAWGLLIN